jgi:hypothetical protein
MRCTHVMCVVVCCVVLCALNSSAVIFFISSAVSIPATFLLCALPFMGSLRVSFFWYDFLALGFVLLGIAIYRSAPEEEPGGADADAEEDADAEDAEAGPTAGDEELVVAPASAHASSGAGPRGAGFAST